MTTNYQHHWVQVTSSLSGYWTCSRCGLHMDGGLHDGGYYYPGRGRYVPPCPGEKLLPLQTVEEHNIARERWNKDVEELRRRTGVACPECSKELLWLDNCPVLGGVCVAQCPACNQKVSLVV